MSTRGTYKIYDDYNRLDIYFYIHHDNYPEGAAYYFQKMLDYMEMNKEEYVRPTYAEAFFRVNNEAHFTKSHAAHGIQTISTTSSKQIIRDISFKRLKLIVIGNDTIKSLHN